MTMRPAGNTGFLFLDVVTKPSARSTATSTSYVVFSEFGALGTYVVDLTIAATHQATSTEYSDTGRYTFHVGPVAELEARAERDAAAVAGNQVAFKVTALNHGPDSPPAAQVTLTPPPGLQFVRGETGWGSFDPATGVWDIGMLETRAYYLAGDLGEGPTLTVIAEVTGDYAGGEQPVGGRIENVQDYCVRIKSSGTFSDDLPCDGSAAPTGYTQHSAKYYDHRPDNNEFSFSADWRALAGENVAPYVIGAGVTSTPGAGDAYQIGETIVLEVTFSEPVRVQGTPTLALEIGEVTRQVPMSAHRGAKLTFRYAVAAGDTDSDGVSVPRDGLTLPEGASITNLSGRTAAVLQFLGFGNQAKHKVSTQAVPEPEPPPFYIDPPSAPQALIATPGNGQVLLEWAPYCCDQKDIFYQLWRGDFPTWQKIQGSDQYTAEHTVTGLTNGDAYRFRVRAVYRHRADDGTTTEHPGAASRMVVATPYDPTPVPPPATPTPPNRPPVFERPANESFSVVERAPKGTEVARVRATDPDKDPLTYTLSGENHSKFSIAKVGGEGVITVAEEELSYTWEPGGVSFNIGVEVTDNRGGRDNRVVGVEVTPSEKRNNPPVAQEPGELYVSCNAAAGTKVVDIMAEDDEGDALWYILVSGADYFKFEGGITVDDEDSFWHGEHAKRVSDGSGVKLQVAPDINTEKVLSGDICGKSIWVVVEIEEEDNPGNNDTLSFEVRVADPPSASSRSTGPDEGGSFLLAALRSAVDTVRGWWTGFTRAYAGLALPTSPVALYPIAAPAAFLH